MTNEIIAAVKRLFYEVEKYSKLIITFEVKYNIETEIYIKIENQNGLRKLWE